VAAGAYGVPLRHGHVAQCTRHIAAQLEHLFGGGDAHGVQHVAGPHRHAPHLRVACRLMHYKLSRHQTCVWCVCRPASPSVWASEPYRDDCGLAASLEVRVSISRQVVMESVEAAT
jgi:hypothetical protein